MWLVIDKLMQKRRGDAFGVLPSSSYEYWPYYLGIAVLSLVMLLSLVLGLQTEKNDYIASPYNTESLDS